MDRQVSAVPYIYSSEFMMLILIDQGLNLLYVDAPVGAGYSYSTTQSGYVMDDYKHVAQLYEFLRKVGDI